MVEGTLQEACFAGARLDGAQLSRALANGLDLRRASLIETNCYKAAMEESDLSDAIAMRVRLQKTQLNGSKFANADCGRRIAYKRISSGRACAALTCAVPTCARRC